MQTEAQFFQVALMKLKQHKSKWQVVGDCGKVYSTHKSKTAASHAMDLKQAYSALANGWNRCTPEQQKLLEKDQSEIDFGLED